MNNVFSLWHGRLVSIIKSEAFLVQAIRTWFVRFMNAPETFSAIILVVLLKTLTTRRYHKIISIPHINSAEKNET